MKVGVARDLDRITGVSSDVGHTARFVGIGHILARTRINFATVGRSAIDRGTNLVDLQRVPWQARKVCARAIHVVARGVGVAAVGSRARPGTSGRQIAFEVLRVCGATVKSRTGGLCTTFFPVVQAVRTCCTARFGRKSGRGALDRHVCLVGSIGFVATFSTIYVRGTRIFEHVLPRKICHGVFPSGIKMGFTKVVTFGVAKNGLQIHIRGNVPL